MTLRARAISIDGEPVPANADGELYQASPSYAWTVHPAAWRILAPANGSPEKNR